VRQCEWPAEVAEDVGVAGGELCGGGKVDGSGLSVTLIECHDADVRLGVRVQRLCGESHLEIFFCRVFTCETHLPHSHVVECAGAGCLQHLV